MFVSTQGTKPQKGTKGCLFKTPYSRIYNKEIDKINKRLNKLLYILSNRFTINFSRCLKGEGVDAGGGGE